MANGRKDMFRIGLENIKVDEGYNVRNMASDTDFEELKASISQMGVQTPLTVRKKSGDLVVVAGHRRHRAVSELLSEGVEIKDVPVLVVNLSEEELALDLIVSNSGKPLNMVEQGAVFARMENFGWKQGEIAAKTGKSTAHISNSLKLHRAPVEIKSAIGSGKVSGSTALEVLREAKGDEAKAKEILANASTQALSQGRSTVTRRQTKPKPTFEKAQMVQFEELVSEHFPGDFGTYLLKRAQGGATIAEESTSGVHI